MDRAEKRLRMRAVDSFWRVFDRLINMKVYPLEQLCSWGWFPGDYHFWQDGTWRILRTIQFNKKSLTHRTLHALSRFVHENKFFRSSTPSKLFEKQFSFVKSWTKVLSLHCRPCFSTLSTGGFSPNHFKWAPDWAYVRCRSYLRFSALLWWCACTLWARGCSLSTPFAEITTVAAKFLQTEFPRKGNDCIFRRRV